MGQGRESFAQVVKCTMYRVQAKQNMANNYCDSSSLIRMPDDKKEKAKEIMARVEQELLDDPDEGYANYIAEIHEDGVWIHSDESVNPNHMERLVKALVEELDLPGIHVCSWSYSCSKLRIDEFGGGAFAVQKGATTVWVDAADEARNQAAVLSIAEKNV